MFSCLWIGIDTSTSYWYQYQVDLLDLFVHASNLILILECYTVLYYKSYPTTGAVPLTLGGLLYPVFLRVVFVVILISIFRSGCSLFAR